MVQDPHGGDRLLRHNLLLGREVAPINNIYFRLNDDSNKGRGAIIRELYRDLIQRIRRYDEESGRRRPHLWYIGERAPTIEWIDNSIEADFRRIDKWQNPSIRFSYTGKDLIERPKWEPGERGFMEPFWWPLVYSLILIITFDLIWGFMNCVGF